MKKIISYNWVKKVIILTSILIFFLLFASNHSSAYSHKVVDTSELSGSWSFNENTGNIAYDSTDNKINGTIINGSWVKGISGSGIHLNGVNSYVELPDMLPLNMTTSMTLSAWVNFDSICQSNNPIIQKDNSYGLKVLDNGRAIGFIWSGFEPHYSTTSIVPHQWYHITSVFDSGLHNIYINGVLENQSFDEMKSIPFYIGPVYIGKGIFGCNISASIDEVKVYKRALSFQEVQYMYATFMIPSTPTELKATNSSQHYISLSWSYVSDNQHGFKIYRSSLPDNTPTLISSTDKGINTFTDVNINCGEHYFYEISAYNSYGESDHTSQIEVAASPCTINKPPITPENIYIQNTTRNSITLTWTDSITNEDSFIIYRSHYITDILDVISNTPSNTTIFTDTDVYCGSSYYYELSANNSAGESLHTAPVKAQTQPCISSFTTYIPIARYDILLASVLTPFDASFEDLVGPSNWMAKYGKTPEIISTVNGNDINILAQDYNQDTPWNAVMIRIKKSHSDEYYVDQVLTQLPMLDRIMGLASDSSGNRYYATGVDEDILVSPTYPPLNTYRSNIVRLIKVDPFGNILFNTDVDIARHSFNPSAEMIVNPMTFATSRLAIAGNEIALVHGINTNPDWNINGVRHQKALSTRFNASTGEVTQTSASWVSHSFDQRLLADGDEIIELQLGDAYPRYILFSRKNAAFPILYIKGETGENNTYTRLGNAALIENDPNYRYISVFSTESTPDTLGESDIKGPRNLGFVRIGQDNKIDSNLPDSLPVTSAKEQFVNQLKWLTNYTVESHTHAERPKLVPINNNQYIVLWESWTTTTNSNDIFNGVYAMSIDQTGSILYGPNLITDKYHLHRGDDAFSLDSKAMWVTGNKDTKELHIHTVDLSLNYKEFTIK